jgi:predicted RND superfamily exporter protein
MIIAVMVTFSIYGLTGHQLNIFSVVIPSLIMIMGLINVLHILNEFEITNKLRGQFISRKEIITETLRNVFRPCLFTALTTIIGFLALLSSSTLVLREFGLFAAIGILIAFACSFVFSGVVLQFGKADRSESRIPNRIAHGLVQLSDNVQSNRKKYITGLVIFTVIAIYGMSQVRSDMLVLGYLPQSNEVVRDHNFITDNWGDYFPMDFLVHAREGTDLRNPAILRALNKFQKEAVGLPEIRSGSSIINLIDRVSQVTLKKNVDKLLESPIQTDRMWKSLINRHNVDYSNLLTEDYKTARITLTGPMMSVSELRKRINQIEEFGDKHFAGMATLSVTSYPALYLKIMKYAVDSMVRSLGLALVLIAITLMILLKNIKLALLAMIPNIFPLILMFAVMGFAGINLDLATATVASIALGVAVDDTIHFLSHFQKERKSNNKDLSEAITATHFHVGRIIVISSIVLCAGYLVLLLASIKTVFYFGILTLVVVVGAMIGDLIILPLLLKWNGSRLN